MSSSLHEAIMKITRKCFLQRGFRDVRIIRDWDIIIGIKNARLCCFPVRVSYSTLFIEVYNPAIATKINYNKMVILDKLSGYFDDNNPVTKINIKQKFRRQKQH